MTPYACQDTDQDGATPTSHAIANVTKHRDYNARNYNNDIAVITLQALHDIEWHISHNIQEPVPFTEAVTPACLPSISPRLREDKVREDDSDDNDEGDDGDDVPCSSRLPL